MLKHSCLICDDSVTTSVRNQVASKNGSTYHLSEVFRTFCNCLNVPSSLNVRFNFKEEPFPFCQRCKEKVTKLFQLVEEVRDLELQINEIKLEVRSSILQTRCTVANSSGNTSPTSLESKLKALRNSIGSETNFDYQGVEMPQQEFEGRETKSSMLQRQYLKSASEITHDDLDTEFEDVALGNANISNYPELERADVEYIPSEAEEIDVDDEEHSPRKMIRTSLTKSDCTKRELKMFRCKICGSQHKSFTALTSHMSEFHQKNDFHAGENGDSNKEVVGNVHQRSRSVSNQNFVKPSTSESPPGKPECGSRFFCNYCDKSYVRKYRLRLHYVDSHKLTRDEAAAMKIM